MTRRSQPVEGCDCTTCRALREGLTTRTVPISSIPLRLPVVSYGRRTPPAPTSDQAYEAGRGELRPFKGLWPT